MNKTIHKDLLLGIDIGTTGTKCSFYNFKGEKISSGYQEYRMIHPQNDWTEQDPLRWWQAVKENIQLCIDVDNIDTKRVACIGVSSTNAVMLMGKNKVIYNGVGLHDQRAKEQENWLKEHIGDEKAFKITGNNIVKGSFALPTLRWFIDNRPDLIEETEKFLIPNGFIIKKLTDEYSIDRPRSGLTLMNDLNNGGWSSEIIELAQIPEDILPPIFNSYEIVGEVTKRAAKSTGLCEGTPVCAGAIDTISASLASGVIAPGDAAITIGSSGRVCQVNNKPYFKNKVLSTPYAFDNLYAAVQTTDNAGISLKWFRDTFGKVVFQDALNAGISIYEQMNRLCAKSQPQSPIIFLPYLSGEKSPIWNPNARGVFFGISLKSSYSDFIRAIMEGVAFSIKHCIENLMDEHEQSQDTPVPIGGGIANSDIWCQIFADVLQRPVIQLATEETETLGDIIIAASAVGINDIKPDFGKVLAKKGKIKTPSVALKDLYEEKFTKYKELYTQVKHIYVN